MENISKFSQGSIWQWSPEGEIQYNEGVQAGPRPVLIISNNTFNTHSASVNCLTITSVLKDSPVHVPIHLSTVSHIQCEQLQTIPKKELSEFKGVVSHETMRIVKDKLKFQLNMTEEKGIDLRNDIENRLQSLSDQVKLGIRGNEHDFFTMGVLKELLSNVADMKRELTAAMLNRASVISKPTGNEPTQDPLQTTNENDEPINEKKEKPTPIARKPRKPKKQPVVAKREKAGRRSYSDEDKAFIVDENNSLDDLVEKYDYPDKETAYKVRYYFKRVNAKAKQAEMLNQEPSQEQE